MAVVGIDLGTTNTVIAAVRDGRATALKDKVGRALLPSVVSFTAKGGVKVGYEAKDRRTIDPENTVFSIKRLIGRTFDSEHVQKARGRLPFALKEGPGKSTLVSCYGQDYTLPEISALVLEQAQKIAEARLGSSATDAVITVPANFNDLQRAATKVAGRTAGLEVLRIINEPTAAALAYGFGKTGRERIAVYDFGGGTFDVTLLDLSENVFEVLATAGDTFLGGDDIDIAIMERMAEELLKKHKVDADKDNLVREQLRAAAEKLKIDLSTRSMGKVTVEELDFEFTMRRSEFETLTEPLLVRTLEVCQEAMDVAGITKRDLDQVLLVGGTTRIPLVRRRISSFFGKMPQSRINPDEVVAIGASIQASSLEAKQTGGSIPAAPRGRASHHPSRAPSPLASPGTGTTQTGLAGLKRTGAGLGASSPPPGTSEGSVLSGLKSVPPSVHPATGPGKKLGPSKTLAGVGPDGQSVSPPVNLAGSPRPPHKTLSGVGGEESPVGRKRTNTLAGLTEQVKGTTNLGLGGATPSSPPPMLGKAPPSVRKSGETEDPFREKQGTLPGAAAPEARIEEDEVTDGSVTFDLAALEALEGQSDGSEFRSEGSGFETLDEETTAVVEAAQVAALAAGSIQDLGDSALMSMDSLEDEVDLPAPVSSSERAEELSDSALFTLEDDSFEESDLPSPVADLPSPKNRELGFDETTIGLPSPLQEMPKGGTGLPDVRRAGLPAVAPGAGLPALIEEEEAALPLVGQHLPAPRRTASAELRLGLGRTQIGVPAPASPDFGAARSPSVDELDELSVAALLPEDPEDEASADSLQFPGVGGATLPLPRAVAAPARPRLPSDPPSPLGATSLESTSSLGSRPMEDQQIQPFPLRSPSVPPPFQAPPGQPMSPQPQARPVGTPLLLDVTPLSLGVEVSGGYVDRLIERNSPIPCEMTRTFATAQDNQAVVRVRVSQGEEDRFERNTVLGEVQLTGLSQGPRGSVKVDVSFSLDESGMLQVSARDQATGNAAGARLMLQGVGH